MNLEIFTRIVRPARICEIGPTSLFPCTPTDLPILLYGHGEGAVDVFARTAGVVGYGSAFVLTGVPTKDESVVDRVEQIARDNDFRTWYRGIAMAGFPEDARSWIKSHWDGNTYGSHLPHLLKAVELTTGPVLELGSGDSSTPHLHDVCERTGRLLLTVESDQGWLARYHHLLSGNHHFEFHADPSDVLERQKRWGVVFVDHSPGQTRRRAVALARPLADYIVVHDTEELGYGLEEILSSFKHRKDFRYSRPWTTVVSDSVEIWS